MYPVKRKLGWATEPVCIQWRKEKKKILAMPGVGHFGEICSLYLQSRLPEDEGKFP
jgi:hypothetical protein